MNLIKRSYLKRSDILFPLYGKSSLKMLRQLFNPALDEIRAHKLVETNTWPSPSPYGARDYAPTVLNVPTTEKNEFLRHVVSRYVKTLQQHAFKNFSRFLNKKEALDLVSEIGRAHV